MDDAAWHWEDLREKHLPVEDITAYNHLDIYLRWCMEHQLMDEVFLERYPEVVTRLQADPEHTDLRPFLRDELDGKLLRVYFNDAGEAFARYYYGGEAPYFPSDIDDYALQYFDAERYHREEFRDEAYLFIPFDEAYYDALPERLAQELGDATLAAECYSFLPEICAENAYDQITFAEDLNIQVGDTPAVTVWKNQIADYWPLHRALFALFEEGAFGEAVNDIYSAYISVSSIFNVIRKMQESEQGTKLEDVKAVAIYYCEDADFVIR